MRQSRLHPTDRRDRRQLWPVGDNPIWVDYPGVSRFLRDDIVTVRGTVTGLQKYEAVLGNNVTIPQIEAADIQLGDAGSAAVLLGSPQASRSARNLRRGPGTTYPLAR